jgi:hypothetical protein
MVCRCCRSSCLIIGGRGLGLEEAISVVCPRLRLGEWREKKGEKEWGMYILLTTGVSGGALGFGCLAPTPHPTPSPLFLFIGTWRRRVPSPPPFFFRIAAPTKRKSERSCVGGGWGEGRGVLYDSYIASKKRRARALLGTAQKPKLKEHLYIEIEKGKGRGNKCCCEFVWRCLDDD